jgi:hypothetical protein
VLHEPHTCRHLLKEVFDCFKAGCSWNEPYHYTTGDVWAIATHVSHSSASISQLEADFQQLSTACDHTPLSTKCKAHLAFRKHQTKRCEQLATVQTQWAQQEHWMLEEHLARSSLAKQISKQTYTPIAPKLIVINFTKTTTADLIRIFKLKITATTLWLKPVIELEEHWIAATPDQCCAFESLADKIQSFGFDLESCMPAVTCI